MRRRKLFTLAAGVSAVVCVAVCGLWVRGYRGVDDVFYSAWDPPTDPNPAYPRRTYHGLRTDPGGVTASRGADSVESTLFFNRGIFERNAQDGVYHRIEPLGPRGQSLPHATLITLDIFPDGN